MEDKIEDGEYIRYTGGYIDIVKEIVPASGDETGYASKHIRGEENPFITYDRIVNHSKNIIDLIKKGDYINGHLVVAVYLEGTTKYIKLDNSYSIENNFAGVRIYAEDIKSIVTKEMMESIEYRVE